MNTVEQICIKNATEAESWLPRDPRSNGYFIFDHPQFLTCLVATYLMIVMKWGPSFMQHRKPYNLKPLTRVFNLCQVLANLYYVFNIIYYAYFKLGMSVYCQGPLIIGSDEYVNHLVSITHFYLCVRISDFLDTIFFVFSKKSSHVTFLHVYHHITVVVNGYIYCRSGWAPLMAFGSVLNACIHIIMYSYYFLSTFHSLKKHLWWKRYITMFQLIQFFFIAVQLLIVIFDNCGYPNAVIYNSLANVVLFIFLFSKFYVDNYSMKTAVNKDK